MDRRKLGGVLCVVAIVALLAGAFTRRWLAESHGGEELGVGLLGIEVCEGSRCATIDYGDARESEIVWLGRAGQAAVACTLALTVLLGFLAYRGATGAPAPWLALAGVLLSVGAIVGGLAVLGFAKQHYHAVGVGWSAMVYLAGAVAGVVASGMLRRPMA